uniref:Ferric enterobactin uptake receptor n=1 Tax=uncultured Helicobacter sp. TaxID=175537 RepID=A0A650ELL2_9HELI|nr:ferric enterobactin uptake receptor [uncultured Helicobacter sp.]
MNKFTYISLILSLLFTNVLADSANPNNDTTKTHNTQEHEEIHKVKLEKSVVTASGFEQDYTLAPASISVVSPKEMQSRPIRDLAEALANVPGVSTDASVGKTGGYGISIRGLASGYTLILVDGKRINADSSLFPNGFSDSVTSFMPPLSAISRIEVIRGPASTLYGSDAIGGVVNIITKKSYDSPGAFFGYDYTFQEKKAFGNTQSFNFFTTQPLNKEKNWGLQLRGRVYTRDFVSSNNLKIVPTTNGTNANATRGNIVGLIPAQTYNIGGRIVWNAKETADNNISKNMIYLDLDYAQQHYDNSQGIMGGYNAADSKSEAGKRAENGYGSEMNFYRFNAILAHKGYYTNTPSVISYLSTDMSLQYNITANPNRYVPTETFSDKAPTINNLRTAYGVAAGNSRQLTAQDIIFDYKTNMFFDLLRIFGINVSLGGRYWLNTFKDKVFQATGNKAFQHQHIGALFAEGEFVFWDKLFLTLGVRGNFNSTFGSNASPRAYIAYNIIDKWLSIKGGVSTGYKTPALSNLINGIVNLSKQGKTHTYGNPYLKPESSVNYELSILSDNDYFSASLTGFYTDFTDRIAPIPFAKDKQNINGKTCTATGGCATYLNIDKAKSYGIETTFGIKPIGIGYGAISFNSAYTHNQTKISQTLDPKAVGKRLTNIPLHNFNASLHYDIKKLSFYLREEIKAGIYRGSAKVINSAAAALGEFYKPVFLTHLGINYQPLKLLRINFAIYNLFNFNFVHYKTFDSGKQIANHYRYIGEGRRYYLSAQMNF